MSLKDLNTSANTEMPDTDNLGGSRALDSGLYKMVVDMAYTDLSSGGATAIAMKFKSADPDVKAEFRNTLYITSGKAKGQKTYYMGGKDGKQEIALPDFNLFSQISLILVGKKPNELDEEPKTIKVWDREARAEVNKEKQVLTELLGKPIRLGIRKKKANRRAKNQSTGNYEDTNESVTFNDLHRVFYPDGFSVKEKAKGAEKPLFAQTWKDKHHSDYVEDEFKAVGGGSTGTPAAAASTAEAAAATEDIFND